MLPATGGRDRTVRPPDLGEIRPDFQRIARLRQPLRPKGRITEVGTAVRPRHRPGSSGRPRRAPGWQARAVARTSPWSPAEILPASGPPPGPADRGPSRYARPPPAGPPVAPPRPGAG